MKIPFSVIILHFLLLFVFMNFHPQKKEKKPAQLKVHHICFQPKEKESHVEESAAQTQEEMISEEVVGPQIVEEAPKETPIVEEKPAPPPKKEIVKKEIPKKAEPKKTVPKPVQPQAQKKVAAVKKPTPAPQPKKTSSPKPNPPSNPNREKLYALMQESLKKLDKPRTSNSHSSKPVEHSNLPALASEALKFEATYQDSLVALLEERLEFPEKGKVKIKLTIKKDGNFKNLEILQSASDKNAKYLQAALQTMVFPSLQKFFPKEDAHTFLISLTSEKSR